MTRILDDAEIKVLADELLAGGPVQLPEGANADDTLDRLIGWAPGLQETHIAEETEGDGIIIHA